MRAIDPATRFALQFAIPACLLTELPNLPRPRNSSSDKSTINSFNKMMAVLGCFSVLNRRLSLGQIAEATKMPKTTVHRILAALREIGFIEQDPHGNAYALGLRLFQLGSLVLANMDLHREAKPLVDHLTKVTQEAVHLAVFDGTQVVVIERKDRTGDAPSTITELETTPAHCTGVGKAVLAFQDSAVIDRILASPLRAFTRNSLTDAAALRHELQQIREHGYALDNAEHQIGVRCVAAPIRNANGAAFAAISVTGPADRFPDPRVPLLAEIVIHAAVELSRRLGYRPTA